MRELGFVIHPEKSVLNPTWETVFLAFVISSERMILTLINEQKIKIYEVKVLMTHWLNNNVSLRELVKIKGNTIASFLAVTYGLLHYVQTRYWSICFKNQ